METKFVPTFRFHLVAQEQTRSQASLFDLDKPACKHLGAREIQTNIFRTEDTICADCRAVLERS